MSQFTSAMAAKGKSILETAAKERARELAGEETNTLNEVPETGTKIPRGSDVEDFVKKDLYDNYFNWIPGALTAYGTLPEPSKSRDAGSGLERIGGGIDSGKGDVEAGVSGGHLSDNAMGFAEDIGSRLSDWTGGAASAFRNNFVNDLPMVVDNQAAIAKLLGATAYANEGLIESAQKDMLNIADNTIVALEDGYGSDNSQTFAIMAAVATIAGGVAACFSGVGSGVGAGLIAGGLTIIAGVSSSADLAEDGGDSTDKYDLSADTVDGVLDNMCSELDKVETALMDGENELARLIDRAINDIDADRKLYEARRPDSLLDADDPTDVMKPPSR